jgi:rhodanese-related sulfurtransferase
MQTTLPCSQLVSEETTEIIHLQRIRSQFFNAIPGPWSIYKDILELIKDTLEFMLELEITAAAFAEQRRQPDAPLLLDVREAWEYQTASIPNSLLMPMGEVASRAHTELDPDAPIVVMCHHGARSLNVALWLRDQGFSHAQSLAGGIDAWSRSVDPGIPRY